MAAEDLDRAAGGHDRAAGGHDRAGGGHDRAAEDLDQAAEGHDRAAQDLDQAGEDLDRLSTKELHDRAVRRAEKHFDVKFFWRLLEMIPAAETASGDIGEADFDIQVSRGRVYDAVHSGDGALGEALRPLFIDYLRKHSDA